MVSDEIKKFVEDLEKIKKGETIEEKPEERKEKPEGKAGNYIIATLLIIAGIVIVASLSSWTIAISWLSAIIIIVIVIWLIKAIRSSDKLNQLKSTGLEGEKSEKILGPEERSSVRILWDLGEYAIPIIEYALIILAVVFGLTLFALLFLQYSFTTAVIAAIGLSIIVGIIEFESIQTKITEIPSDPASVGAEKIYGRFSGHVYPAGYFLTIFVNLFGKKYSIRDVDIIDVRRADQDFVIQEVATNDDAIVEVHGHASYEPDLDSPDRILLFIRNGKYFIESNGKLNPDKGIPSLLDNIFLQRQRAIIKKMDLDDALGASEALSSQFTQHLTGKAEDETQNMHQNPESDAKGLGIKFFTTNVTEILIAGRTKEAFELDVQEKFEQKGEVREIVTRVRQSVAKMLAARGIDITELKDEKGKMDLKKIQAAIEKIRNENPERYDAKIDEDVTAFIEYELARNTPGSIIPGMRERLKRKDGSIPFDVIGAGIADLFRRSGEAAPTKESSKPENKPSESENKNIKTKKEAKA